MLKVTPAPKRKQTITLYGPFYYLASCKTRLNTLNSTRFRLNEVLIPSDDSTVVFFSDLFLTAGHFINSWCFLVIQFRSECPAFLPEAFLIWTVAVSLLCYCENISSLATLDGGDLGLSLNVLLGLCWGISKHITVPTDSDLSNRTPLCPFWSFLTSSDALEEGCCLMWRAVRADDLYLHLNSTNAAFLFWRFLYQYSSGLNREFNWNIVSAHRKVVTWPKKGKTSRNR